MTPWRKMEDQAIHQKGLWRWPAKRKRKESGRIGNIKDIQDHEHTISDESTEEMDMEKP